MFYDNIEMNKKKIFHEKENMGDYIVRKIGTVKTQILWEAKGNFAVINNERLWTDTMGCDR